MKRNKRIYKLKIVIIIIIGILICFISYSFFSVYYNKEDFEKRELFGNFSRTQSEIYEEVEHRMEFPEQLKEDWKNGGAVNIQNNFTVDTDGDVKAGYLTDAHCFKMLNINTGKIEYVYRCTSPIKNFLKEMKTYRPDFFLEGGDLVDDHYEEVESNFLFLSDWLRTGTFGQRTNEGSAELLSQERREQNEEEGGQKENDLMPLFHVMGNHEANAFGKSDWLETTGYENPYYYFDLKGWRFIVLDSNNIKSVDGEIDADPQNDAYQGYIKEEQHRWLGKLLRNSRKYNVAIFIHAPIFHETDTKKKEELFVEEEKVRFLIKKYGVKAVFSGHIEDLCHEQDGKTNYYILKGFWKENRDLRNKYGDYLGYFYELSFSPEGKVGIKGFYQKDLSLPFESFNFEGDDFKCTGRF